LLVANFGEGARGSVYIDPPPIEDDAVLIYSTLIDAMEANPVIAPWLTTLIDTTQLLDHLNIPIRDGMRDSEFVQPQPVAGKTNNDQNPDDPNAQRAKRLRFGGRNGN
jgi:hypothetical protein